MLPLFVFALLSLSLQSRTASGFRVEEGGVSQVLAAGELTTLDDQSDDPADTCTAVVQRRRTLNRVRIPVALVFAGAWVASGHYIFTAGGMVISAVFPGAAAASELPAWVTAAYKVWYDAALLLDGVEAIAVGLAGANRLISKREEASSRDNETMLNETRGDSYIAYGSHRPRCCCRADSPEACEVLPANGGIDCPEGSERQPAMCQIQEVINFAPNQTVHGCRCLNTTHCGSNMPYTGHAWCEVDSSEHCGTRYSGHVHKRWDFCMVSGAPLQAVLGFATATRNDFLAAFVPNGHLGEGGSASAVITKYDAVAYRDGWNSPTECFMAQAVETLSACAELCLEDGAPGYNVTGGLVASRHTDDPTAPDPCVAFAYSPSENLCVALPHRAQDSEFSPKVTDWAEPRGWQHFTLKSHLRCKAGVVFDIVKRFDIDRTQTDRFLHLTCKDDVDGQSHKVSCDESVCEGVPWCFVPEGCEHDSYMHPCAPVDAPQCPV